MNILQEYIQLVLLDEGASLPVVKTKDFIKALAVLGYEFSHQNGSHMVYKKTTPQGVQTLPSIPNDREVSKGTLRNVIRAAGLSDKDFARVLAKV